MKEKIKNVKTLIIHQMLDNVTFRSKRPDVFCKKGVLTNFIKFIGKHLYQSLFFTKVAGQ